MTYQSYRTPRLQTRETKGTYSYLVTNKQLLSCFFIHFLFLSRYQYLDDTLLEREKANIKLKDELLVYQKWCHELDKGRIPDGLQEMLKEYSQEQRNNKAE